MTGSHADGVISPISLMNMLKKEWEDEKPLRHSRERGDSCRTAASCPPFQLLADRPEGHHGIEEPPRRRTSGAIHPLPIPGIPTSTTDIILRLDLNPDLTPDPRDLNYL